MPPSVRFIAFAFALPLFVSLLIAEFSKRLGTRPAAAAGSHAMSAASSSGVVAPFEVAQPAFLYVSAEPGELVSDEELNDWYDNEHVPLRLGHIPEFLSGSRYEATDGQQPKYTALYDISDFHLFSETKYTALRANRSPREAALVKRLDTLDRRTCKTLFDTGRTSPAAKDTAPFITTLYIQPGSGGQASVLEYLKGDFLSAVRKLPGWRRTAIHDVVDSLVTSAKHSPKENQAAKYLVVNEWDSSESAEATAAVPSTEQLGEGAAVELRTWGLYRAWDNTASPALGRFKPSYSPPGSSDISDRIRVRRGRRGLTPLDGALLNAPEIANGWNALLGAVRTKNSLPGDVRELMILRVAVRNAAAYEWIHHEHVGRDEGLTTEQLIWLRDLSRPPPSVASPAPFNALQAAAFAFADASTRYAKVPNRVYDTLRSELEKQLPSGVKVEQQLTEAAATTATYNMVSRFLVASDVAEHANVMTPFPAADCQTRTIFVENGVTLHTFVAKHAEKENKPWIVFVNSLLTDHTMWEGVMARLSASYNILAYDQRGHGKSSVPPAPCTIEQLSDDIATLLSQMGIPTPVRAVIGISQGGATTLSFAIRHPDKFEKIVACDTQIKSPEANRKAWDDRIELARTQGMSALADATVPRWFPPGSQLVNGAQEHLVRPMVEGTKPDGFIAGARALQGYDLSAGLSAALEGKKALLVAGEKDGKLPEGLKTLAEQLKADGRDVDFFQVPNAGHLPVFLDNGLQEFLERVERFLEG